MSYDSLIYDILVDWILNGGEFMDKVDQKLARLDIAEDVRNKIRAGARRAYGHLQGVNMDRLRLMSERQLRAELAAIFRW